MIHYNFITFILFLIIFILILKFRNVHIDKFSGELVCNNENNNTYDCQILNILKNEKTYDFIIKMLKKRINDDNSEYLNELSTDVENSQNTINEINESIDYIQNNVRQLNDITNDNTKKYFQNKKIIYEKINNFFNPDNGKSPIILIIKKQMVIQ